MTERDPLGEAEVLSGLLDLLQAENLRLEWKVMLAIHAAGGTLPPALGERLAELERADSELVDTSPDVLEDLIARS
jgi:hypothetical protein